MDFFDKLGKKASETYKEAAEKTGKIAKETKIKLKIADLRSDKNGLYEELGEKVYLEHVAGKKNIDIQKELSNQCSKLDEINREIDELQNQCLKLQDKIKCYKCGQEIEKKVNYCPNCGVTQPVIEVEEDIEENDMQVEIEELENVNKEEKKEENKKSKETKKEEKQEEKKAQVELAKTVKIESAIEKDDKKKEEKQ